MAVNFEEHYFDGLVGTYRICEADRHALNPRNCARQVVDMIKIIF